MAEALVFTHATIVTGDRDGTVLQDQTVLTNHEGKIVQVILPSQFTPPVGARITDASSRYLLPGLINAHAHLFSDGKPLPPVLTNERAEKLVSMFIHSSLGGRWLQKRTRNAVVTQMNTGGNHDS